jgi:NAD(P)-dependent dehydrogenase (short-subunit alcohol dehydrogenase family)
LQKLAKETSVHVTELDVSSPASITEWASNLKTQHGVKHVDLLINNAGILEGSGLSSVDAEEMVRLFMTNTVGPLLVTQQLHKQGLLGKPGSIVANMTSKMGSVEDNNGMGSYYSYRASKSALNNVTKSLSLDLARDGIVALVLHPGFVQTDMVGGAGNISAKTSAAGLLNQLESRKPAELNGKFLGWNGEEIPW